MRRWRQDGHDHGADGGASVERVGAVKTAALVGRDAAEARKDAPSNARGVEPSSSPAALSPSSSDAPHRAPLAAAARAADAGHASAMAVTEFKVVHGSGVEGLCSSRRGGAFGPPRRARFETCVSVRSPATTATPRIRRRAAGLTAITRAGSARPVGTERA